ncbi:MAG: Fe-S cluster assembly protein SufD [Thermaerobacter sp.]|nr:Fe-S cluster assembly protein SufD [Thermaerobacter sp.]
MNSVTAQKNPADVRHLLEQRFRDEPLWLAARRRELAEAYVEHPLPPRQRTPLKNRKLEQIPIFDAPASAAPLTWRDAGDEAHLRLVDGVEESRHLPATLTEQGVLLLSLAEAIRIAPQLVEQYLGSVIDERSDKFQALNGAFWQNGLFLYVPPRTEVTLPIAVTHAATAGLAGFFPRTLIIADRQSRVVVSERYLSAPGERSLVSAATEIIALDGASVQYGSIQQLAPSAETFSRRAGRVGRDARIDWNIGEFGGGLLVAEHQTILDQPGGQTSSLTVFFGGHHQHQDYTAESRHVAPHTGSNMVARGVMKDHARSVFTGVTDIKPGAVGTDGRQKEQTLMLSPHARADAIPSLLIEERDVYAAHSASAGPADRSAIFYLMGRGIPETEAIRLIVHGFLAPVIDSIPLQSLRDEVWEAVERKIRG